jgi:membrane protein YdbS with pleckstrin-like domain
MRAELQNVDQRVAKIESTLQQLANVVVLTARQDEKLNAIERRVDSSEQAGPARHP